jgi:hypothetical protein
VTPRRGREPEDKCNPVYVSMSMYDLPIAHESKIHWPIASRPTFPTRHLKKFPLGNNFASIRPIVKPPLSSPLLSIFACFSLLRHGFTRTSSTFSTSESPEDCHYAECSIHFAKRTAEGCCCSVRHRKNSSDSHGGV